MMDERISLYFLHDKYSRRAVGFCLVAFLIALYFVTFSGYAISRDEWFLFDATESMARHGTMEQNFEFDAYPPVSLSEARPPSADTEPMHPMLAAPLFLIAQALPGIGLVHTVWLFNILVTALTAGTLYAYGLALGYRAHVAALVALIFGLGTIAWPYSRTFFREPLFTWFGLLSAYLIVRVRQELTAGRRPVLTLTLLALVLAGALLSKEVTLLLLPAFLIEALPTRWRRVPLTRRRVIVLVIGLVVLAILLTIIIFAVDRWVELPNRYDPNRRLEQARENLSDLSTGIRGYLFSPSRSMWIFSPVLLLGFAGWPHLIRQRRWRELLVPLVVIAAFVIGYAAVRGSKSWAGGRGWGSRYLIPVTPFVALWLLPVINAILQKRAAWWKRLGIGIVFLFSAAIQVAAALVNIQAYDDKLAAEGISVHDGLWTLRWSQIPVTFGLLNTTRADLAWKYAVGRTWPLPVLCAILAAAALGWALWWMRRPGTRRTLLITAASLAVITALALGGGLYAIRHDPRYAGNFQPTHDLLNALEKQVEPDDVIVLNDFTYSEFFMNYYKLRRPTIYTLPVSPGERYSPEQAPAIESPNPEDLIHLSDTIIFANFAQHHDRLWLVISSSSFIPWSVRPVEHYLARHYFPVTEVKPSDLARAVLFDMTPAPSPTAEEWPAHAVGATFGDCLRLVGYDIPGGTIRPPGDILPVSLLWETRAPVPQDYTVALFIMTSDGKLIAQRDSYPVNAFDPTQDWRPRSLHRDNHGVQLPAHLPPGEYELWAAVYWWQAPEQRLPVIGADGKPLGDHAVLGTVTIQ